MGAKKHVVVVGGGIAGLSAARALASAQDGPRVTVLEASPRLGGKIQTSSFGGLDVDTGPDAFLAAAPAASRLCTELGLGDSLIAPAASKAWIYSHGKLRPFPLGTVLGVPSNIFSLASLISLPGMMRSVLDLVLPARVGRTGDDPTIGQLIRARLGNEVADRMIDPLVGGINAGSIDQLSLRTAVPQVATLADSHRSLLWAASRKKPKASKMSNISKGEPNRRVFLAPPNGMAQLVDALSDRLKENAVEIKTSTPVTSISHDGKKWSINGSLHADAVILATPSYVAAGFIRDLEVRAATLLSSVRYSSVAMVRLAYKQSDVSNELAGSGFLVPAVDETLMTACSWASSKWSRLAKEGQVLFRVSAGRFNDTRALELSGDVLVKALHQELRIALGISGEPVEFDVTRWDRAFPQYEPGHVERVKEARVLLAGLPPIALAGAAYDGVGIPACIESGEAAGNAVLEALR